MIQEEAINAKSKNLATIEELERLFPLLKDAVAVDIREQLAQKAIEIELKAKEGASIEIAEQVRLRDYEMFCICFIWPIVPLPRLTLR